VLFSPDSRQRNSSSSSSMHIVGWLDAFGMGSCSSGKNIAGWSHASAQAAAAAA
jgi:hypothetical protein